MRKEGFLAIVLLLLITILIAFVTYNLPKQVLLSPGDNIHIPSSCSDSEIQATWDSIFYESNTGITIKSNTSEGGKCNAFLAYKVNNDEMFYLVGSDLNTSLPQEDVNQTRILAMRGNFTQEYIDKVIYTNITSDIDYPIYFLIIGPDPNSLMRNITSTSEAETQYNSIFRNPKYSWELISASNVYVSSENETTEKVEKYDAGVVFANQSIDYYLITIWYLENQSCIPNWVPINTSCTQDETIITYYTDANNCNLAPPENETSYCDYNSNGLIGNFSELSTNLNLQVYINNTLAYSNTTETFSSARTIEFREGPATIISFDYNFEEPLNIKKINITKQPASSDVGYLVVRGLEAEKTLAIDKLNNQSWKVCIKDTDVESIDELTERCTATNEYPVSCPGNLSGFTCTILDNKFLVTNLDNSAVKELINISGSADPGDCTSNWLCSSWSSCSNNQQTRNCIDANNCSIPTNIPNETWACISCNTNWTCTNWTPSSCPESKTQTRICTDTNNCGTQTNKPSQTQTCIYEEPNYFFWIILIILIILIIIVAIAIVVIWNEKQSQPQSSRFRIQQKPNL